MITPRCQDHPTPRTLIIGLALSVITMLAAACTSSPPAATPAPLPAPAPVQVRADPPTRFASTEGWPLPVPIPDSPTPVFSSTEKQDDPVMLAGHYAYIATPHGLTLLDTTTRRSLRTVPPRSPIMDRAQPGKPTLTTLGGKETVLAAFPVTVPGHGTTPPAPGIELLALDAHTGGTRFRDLHTLPVPNGETYRYTRGITPTVLGTSGPHTIIKLATDNTEHHDAVLVTDHTRHTLDWFRGNFEPVMLADRHVIGIDGAHGKHLTALSVTEQTPRWTLRDAPATNAHRAGPNLIAVPGSTPSPGNRGTPSRLIDATTGADRAPWPNQTGGYDCTYDQQSVTICTHPTDQIIAFDTASATPLWYLPAHGRIAPTVTTTWHGAVYGTTVNGPVVLDARTGTDRDTHPGIAPTFVSGYGGLTKQPNSSLTFHPTQR